MALVPCPTCGLAQPDRLGVCQRCGALLQPQGPTRLQEASEGHKPMPIETTVVVPRHPGPQRLQGPTPPLAPLHDHRPNLLDRPTPFPTEGSQPTDPTPLAFEQDGPTIVRSKYAHPPPKPIPFHSEPVDPPPHDTPAPQPKPAPIPFNNKDKPQDGTEASHQIVYARTVPLFRLWLAWCVDGCLAALPSFGVANVLLLLQGMAPWPPSPGRYWQLAQTYPKWTILLLLGWGGCAMSMAFFASIGTWATWGQRLCQLNIIFRHQAPLPIHVALWRILLTIPSFLVLGAGFFWSLVDLHHRPWHDIFSRSQTIQRTLPRAGSQSPP